MKNISKMKNKNIMYFLGALIVIGIVVLVIVLTRKKDAVTTIGGASGGTSGLPKEDCVPYTQQMFDRDMTKIRSACYPKLLIPVVGIGYYNKCVTERKTALPFINEC